MNRNLILSLIGVAGAIVIFGCVFQTMREKKEMPAAQQQVTQQVTQGLAGQTSEKCEKQTFAMDTYMTFTAYGEHAEAAVDTAMSEVRRLDEMLSTGKEESEVAVLNRDGQAEVSEEVLELLERSKEIYEETGGLLDITVYPLMELWGFPSGNYHVATEQERTDLLQYVGVNKITWKEHQITLGEGQKIDFGAIAKGYTSSRLMEIYKMNGITSGMVYLGGNVQTLGTKPDGSKWSIGVQDPTGEQGTVLMVLKVADQAVITSGGYERFFEQDGKRYIHILDPRTGAPVENDLISVTIVSPDGTLADALSTSLFIMGRQSAEQFWRSHKQKFQMILLTTDNQIHITPGLKDDIICDKTYYIIEEK